MSLRSFAAAAVGLLLLVSNVAAETIEQKYEYGRRIKAAQAVGPLGTNLFGDEINYYNGHTSITQVDVSVPGNSDLPVRVARTWSSSGREGPLAPALFGEWELDIPVMHGVFARNYGWQVQTATPNNRCSIPNGSSAEPGAALNKTGTFGGEDYWRGNSIYVPGAGDQQMLFRASGYTRQPIDGKTYNWVTSGHWQISCLPVLASGQPGEGFLAIAPDGTKYTFNWMVSRPYSTIQRSANVENAPALNHQLLRDQVRIYPTRVEDRFGNWVTYTYSGEQVTDIVANDGRAIRLTYNAQNAIDTVTAAGQVWRYEYTTSRRLTRVVQPDQTAWSFGSGGPTLVMVYKPTVANSGCASMGEFDVGASSFSMTHPSGATGTFTFTPTRHARSTQVRDCYIAEEKLEYGPPKRFDNYALTSKTIAGPGLAPMQWGAAYGGACLQCPSKTVTVTNPDQSTTRHTFGTEFYVNEGKLLRTETLSATGALAKDVQNTYAVTPVNPPYAYHVGNTGMSNEDAFGSTMVVPKIQTTITQDGATFNNRVNAFDSYARPLSVSKFSSLGYSKTDVTEYHDDTAKWVLGQVKRQYNAETGIVMLQTDYDAGTALPIRNYSFGKLQNTLGYNGDGTLHTVADGRNLTTTLSNWYRGIPQRIQYADGRAVSAIVSDSALVVQTTDENGYATIYGYDAMGRIAAIVPPGGDSVAWNNTSITFEQQTVAAYGLPAGYWRRWERTGNRWTLSFFDALWRPVVQETYDAGDVSGTLSQTVKRYDVGGRLVFQSYPTKAASSFQQALPGTYTTYDALDRPTRVEQDSELGLLTSTTQYLSGFMTRSVNPRGYGTVTSYQAFDQPDTNAPVGVTMADGMAATEIHRHPYLGRVDSMTRRNNDGSVASTRRYVYDGFQRLCKTIEPETGATVMGYDDAGNVSWSAGGLALPSTTDCDFNAAYASGRRNNRYYDVRNRLASLKFPDGNGDQDWTYTADGLPQQIITYNDAGATAVVNAYTYNRRRLLTGESSSQPNWYGWGIGYGYDANGNLQGQSYPTGLYVDYAPNALGQATRAGSWATGVSYYPNGGIKQFTYGNGIVHTMTQNARQLPARTTDTGGALDHQYVYDNNANVQYIYDGIDPALNRYLYYDGLDRLTSAGSQMFGGDHWHRYTYDALDNMTSSKLAGVKEHNYIYDTSTNRLSMVRNNAGAATMALEYDVQGNLSVKNGQTYTFDYGNRLRGTTQEPLYRYDGHGRRVLAWDPSQGVILSQYSQSGQVMYQHDDRKAIASEHIYLGGSLLATREYHWALGQQKTKYQHTDALGSPVAVTNEAGQVTDRTNYEPYGATIGKVASGIGYTGHVSDAATGLTHMQQRYYDPTLGRFLSVDPVTANSNTGANFNRYKYASNNPYRFTDPDGRQDCEKTTGSNICGGGGASAMLATTAFSAKKFSSKDVQVSPNLSASEGASRSRTVVNEANKASGMANRVGDREFTAGLNAVKRLVVSDKDGPSQVPGGPQAAASSIYSTRTITFFNQFFAAGVQTERAFIHEVFHQTESLEAARVANPNGVHFVEDGFEARTIRAADEFRKQYYDLIKESK